MVTYLPNSSGKCSALPRPWWFLLPDLNQLELDLRGRLPLWQLHVFVQQSPSQRGDPGPTAILLVNVSNLLLCPVPRMSRIHLFALCMEADTNLASLAPRTHMILRACSTFSVYLTVLCRFPAAAPLRSISPARFSVSGGRVFKDKKRVEESEEDCEDMLKNPGVFRGGNSTRVCK